MKAKSRQSGLTLTEMTVVIVAAALLTSLSIPAIRTFFNSLASEGEVKSMISAALSSARAIAAKEQRYAGVRFQEDLYGRQYMIFIIKDPELRAWGYGFRVVEGLKPVKLPENLGVMDFVVVDPIIGRSEQNPISSGTVRLDDPLSGGDNQINDNFELTDTTTFSIIFSPSGKLVIHGIRVRNRDGIPDSTGEILNYSADDVFNKMAQVNDEIGMFYQDDYFLPYYTDEWGLGPEASRNSFVIYDKIEFAKIDPNRRWSDYLYRLAPEMIYINPYTGTIIKR